MNDVAFSDGIFGKSTKCPPVDIELAPVLDTLTQSPRCSVDGHQACRDFYEEYEATVGVDLTSGGKVVVASHSTTTSDGHELEMLSLSPAIPHASTVPGIVFFHGGGMVMGNERWNVDLFSDLVADGLAVVVSVRYRLAPEHPDPTPVEDCYTGLAWVARHASDLRVDAARLNVAGVSAGAGLAAGVALLARDRGFPELSHQVLLCPMLDDRFVTRSSAMLDGAGTWDRNDNLYGWHALLGERRGGPDVGAYSAPARAIDLAELPRTYLDVGSSDVFRDEVVEYAGRLSAAGVVVDLHMWGGGFHGFELDAPDTAISRDANATREAFLRRSLATAAGHAGDA